MHPNITAIFLNVIDSLTLASCLEFAGSTMINLGLYEHGLPGKFKGGKLCDVLLG